jgi:hypothetical protein
MEVTIGSWDGMTRYEIDVEYPGALAVQMRSIGIFVRLTEKHLIARANG